MFSRPFSLGRFLRAVWGSSPFAEYCHQREIPFTPSSAAVPTQQDVRGWARALAELTPERLAQVELDLAMVGELDSDHALDHLIEAAGGDGLPPDSVPGGAALALWFFLNRPDLFREVYLHHHLERVDSWRQAKADVAGHSEGVEGKADALAVALRTSFAASEGIVPFCVVQTYRFGGSVCFFAQVAHRPRFLDTFSDSGRATALRLRPARPLIFLYSAKDGSVLLRCPLRSRQRIATLFALLGDHVLGCPVRWEEALFDLDRLKDPFAPLPDAPDMRAIRLKSLHLRYPARAGSRQLKLETLDGDAPDAVEQMLRRHAGDSLADLRVSYAQLQIGLLTDGRIRSQRIELWPDRCSLPETPLGERLRACLKRWGLCHALKP